MDATEFHYRIAGRIGGRLPGAHAGRGVGTGMHFAQHRRLYEYPDPRRIDVRASLRDPHGDWLVRLARQPVSMPVHLVVDVSASMLVGEPQRKIEEVAAFAAILGASAFRSGDTLGLMGFDDVEPRPRSELFVPPRRGRAVGVDLGQRLRAVPRPPARKGPPSSAGLLACCEHLAGRDALVFLVSDFHGVSDADLVRAMERLWPARVVPMLCWHPSEVTPPAQDGWVPMADAESARRGSLWMRPRLRQQWSEAVQARRQHLKAQFNAFDRPLFELFNAEGRFDPDALTRYFFEGASA